MRFALLLPLFNLWKQKRCIIAFALRLFFGMPHKHVGKVRATRIARCIAVSDAGCLCSLGEREYKFKKGTSGILGDSVLDWVGGQFFAPATLLPFNETSLPISE